MSISPKSLEGDDTHSHSKDHIINEITEIADETNDEPLDPRIQVK